MTRVDSVLLAELFFHLSLLLGFPTMLDGLEKLALLELTPRKMGQKIPSRTRLQKKGLDMLMRVYGDQTPRLLESLKRIHAGLPDMIVGHVYGRVFGRRGMTLKERELVNVTVLTIQGLNRQLYSDIRGALRVGVSPFALRSLFSMLQTDLRVRVVRATQFLSELEKSYPQN